MGNAKASNRGNGQQIQARALFVITIFRQRGESDGMISKNSETRNMCNKKAPDISIIVPVYNVEKYLPQCLDSLLSQNFDNWEAILIDDGSTDSSGVICDEYAGRDERLKVIHTSNHGVAEARNAGLRHASGEYVGFVDPDDWIDSDYYSSLLETAGRSGGEIVVGGFCYEHPSISIPSTCEYGYEEFSSTEYASLLCEDKRNPNYMWNKMFHRRLIYYTPPGIRYFEDISGILQWVLRSNKVVFAPDIKGYHYRQRRSSILGKVGIGKAIAYYDAVMLRNRQFEHHVEESDISLSIVGNIIKGILRSGKSLSRGDLLPGNNNIPSDMLSEMIGRLMGRAEKWARLLPEAMKGLSLKYRIYYRLGMISPRLFIFWARFTRLCHTSHRRHRPCFD